MSQAARRGQAAAMVDLLRAARAARALTGAARRPSRIRLREWGEDQSV
jgi:hypothetical protein